MDNNKDAITHLRSKLLSDKLSTEYAISYRNYPPESDPAVVIIDAYGKACALFNPDSDTSIFSSTLEFYMSHLNEAIESFTKDLESLEAVAKLLPAYFKILEVQSLGFDVLKEKLSSELLNNKNYYELFNLDYFLELCRTNGLGLALSELEEDVNIRANTYYNAAYEDYLDILPGFDCIIDSLTSTHIT